MGHLNSFSASGGGFEQTFSKNSNARRDYPGGMFKFRFDWYITRVVSARPECGKTSHTGTLATQATILNKIKWNDYPPSPAMTTAPRSKNAPFWYD